MSDSALNYFLASGTNAERLAFTPDPATPAVGPDPTYIWLETDTGSTFAWDFGGSAWDQVNTGITQLTGDVTVGPGAGSQAATIANNAVTDAKLRQSSGLSIVGRSANSTGNVADIIAASDGQVMRRSGTAIAFGALDLASANAVAGLLPLANLAARTSSMGITIDGGGAAITTGVKADLYIPAACTITANEMLADQSGSIVIDVWKDAIASYPPTVADTITASAKPTISSATNSQDTTLTGWTTACSAGDTLRFNVDSCSTITRVSLSLKITIP